jgi:hypothetical protein
MAAASWLAVISLDSRRSTHIRRSEPVGALTMAFLNCSCISAFRPYFSKMTLRRSGEASDMSFSRLGHLAFRWALTRWAGMLPRNRVSRSAMMVWASEVRLAFCKETRCAGAPGPV